MDQQFAFKIDRALKNNLYKICRLCGIDSPEMVPIIHDNKEVIDVNEADIITKIRECIGFTITKNDKMPQTMCVNCMEKINEFYEFREMCYATDTQTRKLLGIKTEPNMSYVDIKPKLHDMMGGETPRGKKRKSDALDFKKGTEITISQKKHRMAVGMAGTSAAHVGNFQIQQQIIHPATFCDICQVQYSTKLKFQRHFTQIHLVNIPRYMCVSCDETLKKTEEIKGHQVWHKYTKTPFKCGLCNAVINNTYALSKHLREHAIKVPEELLVLDRICPHCHVTFATTYLYNIHICAVRTLICPGCEVSLKDSQDYLAHLPMCGKAYHIYSTYIKSGGPGGMNDDSICIKNEVDVEGGHDASIGLPLELAPIVQLDCPADEKSSIDNDGRKTGKKLSSMKAMQRMDELLKNTLDVLGSIKHEPEVQIEEDEVSTTRPTIAAHEIERDEKNENEEDDTATTFDDFHDGDDASDHSCDGLNPAKANGNTTTPAVVSIDGVRIKQEIIDESYNQGLSGHLAGNADGVNGRIDIPTLKIKIKKEQGTLNSSIMENEEQLRREKKKKKKEERKKRKSEEWNGRAPATPTMSMPQPGIVCIKQEPLSTEEDDSLSACTAGSSQCSVEAPKTTIMTSIPMASFQTHSSSNSYGREYGTDEAEKDIKPNRQELDRLLQISHVPKGGTASGDSKSGTAVPIKPTSLTSTSALLKPIKVAKILSVRGGAEVLIQHYPHFGRIRIKEEPQNRGYSDEVEHQPQRPRKEIHSNSDFNPNVRIKQEKDHPQEPMEQVGAVPEGNLQTSQQNQEKEEVHTPTSHHHIIHIKQERQDEEKQNQQRVIPRSGGAVGAEHALMPRLSFVISNVRGEATDMMDESTVNNGGGENTISGIVTSKEKESLTEAQPVVEASNKSEQPQQQQTQMDDGEEEEQQNLLNHEVMEATSTEAVTEPVIDQQQQQQLAIENQAVNKLPPEEADNLINEIADSALQETVNAAAPPDTVADAANIDDDVSDLHDFIENHLLLINDNVNEIAENNNNANLEREFELQGGEARNGPEAMDEQSEQQQSQGGG